MFLSFGSSAIFRSVEVRPVTFRPRLATGLAFSLSNEKLSSIDDLSSRQFGAGDLYCIDVLFFDAVFLFKTTMSCIKRL